MQHTAMRNRRIQKLSIDQRPGESGFDQYGRNMKEMSRGSTVKLSGWTSQKPPEEGPETKTYRKFIVDAVNMLYKVNQAHTSPPFKPAPVSLSMIYTAVKNRIVAQMLRKQWKHMGYIRKDGVPRIRMKRYVDRRVNEAASRQYCDQPQIISVRAGYYIPTPDKFLYRSRVSK